MPESKPTKFEARAARLVFSVPRGPGIFSTVLRGPDGSWAIMQDWPRKSVADKQTRLARRAIAAEIRKAVSERLAELKEEG